MLKAFDLNAEILGLTPSPVKSLLYEGFFYISTLSI